MLRLLIIALLALVPIGWAAPSFAQSAVPIVVSSCGTPIYPRTASQNANPTMDTTGKLCTSGTGGGSSVTISGPLAPQINTASVATVAASSVLAPSVTPTISTSAYTAGFLFALPMSFTVTNAGAIANASVTLNTGTYTGGIDLLLFNAALTGSYTANTALALTQTDMGKFIGVAAPVRLPTDRHRSFTSASNSTSRSSINFRPQRLRSTRCRSSSQPGHSPTPPTRSSNSIRCSSAPASRPSGGAFGRCACGAMTPDQAIMLLNNPKSSGTPFTPPVLQGCWKGVGDSEISNSEAGAWVASTYSATTGGGDGYLGQVAARTGNRILFDQRYNYGVGNSSTLATEYRLNSNRFDTGAASLTATIDNGSGSAGTILTASAATVTGLRPNSVVSGGSAGTTVGVNGTASSEGTTVQAQGTYLGVNPSQLVASSTIAATANPAFAQTAFGADAKWSFSSTGQFSPLADTCNGAIVLTGTNDPSVGGGLTETQGMAAYATMLDALGQKGGTINGTPVSAANNYVIAVDMLPRGIGFAQGETHLQNSTTYQVTNHTTFESDDCDGNIVPHVIAPNYLVTAGVGSASNGTNTLLTKVASLPNDGQYTLNTGTGTYTFSANLAVVAPTLEFQYCYTASGRTGAGLAWLLDLHSWLNSSLASFTPTGGGAVLPGALYKRPWVKAAACWNAVAGPTAATTGLNAAGMMDGGGVSGGLHPATHGSAVCGQAIANAIDTVAPAGSKFAYPTSNNFYIIKGNAVLTNFRSASCGSPCASAPLPTNMIPQLANMEAGGIFQVCYQQACYVAGAASGDQGTFTGNGLSSTTGSITASGSGGCINYKAGPTCNGSTAAGAYQLPAFSAAITVNGLVIAYGDPPFSGAGSKIGGNLLVNGQLDWFVPASAGGAGTLTNLAGASCNTANSGASNSNFVPANWVLTGDAGTQTALGAGTLVMTCGYGTAPDGNPGFFVTEYGLTAATVALNFTSSLNSPAAFINPATPDIMRAYTRITVVAGPGGRLRLSTPRREAKPHHDHGGHGLWRALSHDQLHDQFRQSVGRGRTGYRLGLDRLLWNL